MPKRDWVENAIHFVGAFALVAVTFWISLDLTELRTRQLVAEQYGEAAKAQYSNSEIAELCRSGSETVRMKCVVNAIEAREQQSQDTRDLHAQEWMAKWAKWMFWAAAVGSGAALYGLWLLRRTWEEAKRTADIAREIGEAQVRAYLTVDQVTIFSEGVEGGVRWTITPTIRNSGQSPAKNIVAYARGGMFVHGGLAGMIRDLRSGDEGTGEIRNGSNLFPVGTTIGAEMDIIVNYQNVFQIGSENYSTETFTFSGPAIVGGPDKYILSQITNRTKGRKVSATVSSPKIAE